MEKETTKKALEDKIKELETRLGKVVGIANNYIKAYRDLIFSLRSTVETNTNLDRLLNEQSKEDK